MKQKLIAIDLDGTTLNSQSEITPRTKEVLHAASQAGHIVSIVTGRPYRISQQFYDDLGIKTPMINFNGALGHIPHENWNKEYADTFSRDIVFELLEKRNELGIKMSAAEGKTLVLSDTVNNNVNEFFPVITQPEQLLTAKNLRQDPSAMTMWIEPENKQNVIQKLQKEFGDYINVGIWGGPYSILELSPKGINKARGVKFLSDNYNIAREDIIAFGDEHNDTEMLDYVGWGVSMQNGTTELKNLANDITPLTNDQDGLADYLSNYLNLAK